MRRYPAGHRLMVPALCQCDCDALAHKPARRGEQGSSCQNCEECMAWRPLRVTSL